MNIHSCRAENFASYKELEFKFDDKGLILIHGATGAGKSTLCDMIAWALFGRTAKGGAVNEVLSWNNSEPTKVYICVDIKGQKVYIYRYRGKTPKDNDLGYSYDENNIIRGKDLNDTQKCINNLLGIDADLYLAGAYFHEFSQTAQFFTTTAKNRRSITEQLVDLSLPKKLNDSIKIESKEKTSELNTLDNNINTLKSNLSMITKLQETENNKYAMWERNQSAKKDRLTAMCLKFEEEKANTLRHLAKKAMEKANSSVCSECGSIKTAPHKHAGKSEEIKQLEDRVNPYIEQLADAQLEVNPYTSGVRDFSEDIESKTKEITIHEISRNNLKVNITDLDILSDIVAQFRGMLIQNTILDIEEKTNLLLSEHFDAIIRIQLIVEDADKLEVSITKDGNIAAFTQLSKGQRQLLKLCFGVSVMKAVSNHHGVDFRQIWIDESLEGLDENMKLKALGLLEKLSLDYDSIFVVDHSEAIKAMISNKIKVELVNGYSEISRE